MRWARSRPLCECDGDRGRLLFLLGCYCVWTLSQYEWQIVGGEIVQGDVELSKVLMAYFVLDKLAGFSYVRHLFCTFWDSLSVEARKKTIPSPPPLQHQKNAPRKPLRSPVPFKGWFHLNSSYHSADILSHNYRDKKKPSMKPSD